MLLHEFTESSPRCRTRAPLFTAPFSVNDKFFPSRPDRPFALKRILSLAVLNRAGPPVEFPSHLRAPQLGVDKSMNRQSAYRRIGWWKCPVRLASHSEMSDNFRLIFRPCETLSPARLIAKPFVVPFTLAQRPARLSSSLLLQPNARTLP